jgi:hypothetical protein
MTRIAVTLRLRATMSCAGVLLVVVGLGSQRPGSSELAPVKPTPGAASRVATNAEPNAEPIIEIVPDLGLETPPRVVERAGAVERVILGSRVRGSSRRIMTMCAAQPIYEYQTDQSSVFCSRVSSSSPHREASARPERQGFPRTARRCAALTPASLRLERQYGAYGPHH